VVGQVLGGGSDLRDALGAAIHGDWVGAGFNALGAVPGGDLVAIPRKVARFVERNPKRAAEVAAMIMKTRYVPEWIKIRAARAIWSDWDELVAAGADEKALLRLQQGRTDLAKVVEVQLRRGHTAGPPTPAARDRDQAEERIEKLYAVASKLAKLHARLSTEECPDCEGDVRMADMVVDGVVHTTKVGYVMLIPEVQRQIRKDAWLIASGAVQGAHWHVVASSSSDSLGVDPRVLDLLDAAGIRYTVHLPAAV
jgi:hypothetical protein